jgi:hypothetical protein
MNIDNMIKAIAGGFVFLSSLLGFFHSKWWLLFTMFVGLNLFQFAFTGFCPMGIMLKKCGVKE